MIAFLGAAIYFLALFVAIEIAGRKKRIEREISRKAAHVIAGVSAAFLPYYLSYVEIILLATTFLVVMVLSRRLHIFNTIHDVDRHSYGEILFPVAVGSMAFFFPDNATYMYGMLVMAVGDGFAAIVGGMYGKRKYKVGNERKSYLGSSMVLAAALIFGFLLFGKWEVLPAALVLTAVEAVCLKGTDNFFLPVAAGLMAMFWF
jgi:dolichol kinase